MYICKKLLKITKFFIVILFVFFHLQIKSFEKYNKTVKFSDYFSGIVLLNEANIMDL